jgi:Trk K+ transport system NAD-binding subunit
VAVDRGGLSYFDPDADFQLFPGDRLVLLGNAEGLEKARTTLKERIKTEGKEETTFRMKEILIMDDSPWVDNRLSELNLRRRQGISVIGIQRGEQRIISPRPEEVVQPGDILLVMGSPEAISGFQAGRDV